MKIISYAKTLKENRQLKNEVANLRTQTIATEKVLMDRVNDYRKLLGEREMLLDKMNLLDMSLAKKNKILNKIIKIAESNDMNKPEIIIKKILELAKYEQTSPSK